MPIPKNNSCRRPEGNNNRAPAGSYEDHQTFIHPSNKLSMCLNTNRFKCHFGILAKQISYLRMSIWVSCVLATQTLQEYHILTRVTECALAPVLASQTLQPTLLHFIMLVLPKFLLIKHRSS